ncbi:hypothetical protein [Tepidibacter hydrothermalis]|uniref:Uncharacterized protein n=1 Tax=Tepidibacter hydrothermalis TaxID=3036126 RepID=A0ABY8EA89_9FIRM|nr:hypothetical protein [Tepidibacter hydrothermalis]WFD09848.1 hypothetical protein P4S50_15830 [Tepidibacter hydrothermalis]
MNLKQIFKESIKSINKSIWIILIPCIMDILNLISYEKIFNTKYIPALNMISFKMAIISAPPSVKHMIKNFPSPLLEYRNGAFLGIINELTLFNIFLFLTFICLMSFIEAGYLGSINDIKNKSCSLRDFIYFGNKFWCRLFLLNLICYIPFLLGFIDEAFIWISILYMPFFYAEYVIVAENISLISGLKESINVLMNNLGLTIKMMFQCGVLYLPISCAVYILSFSGDFGMGFSIFIVNYFGVCVNKTVFEVYKNLKKPEEVQGGHIDYYV